MTHQKENEQTAKTNTYTICTLAALCSSQTLPFSPVLTVTNINVIPCIARLIFWGLCWLALFSFRSLFCKVHHASRCCYSFWVAEDIWYLAGSGPCTQYTKWLCSFWKVPFCESIQGTLDCWLMKYQAKWTTISYLNILMWS